VRVRVAAAQITCRVGDLTENLYKHRRYAERAREAGAHIVCFPELSLCAYPTEGDIPHKMAEPLHGAIARATAELAEERGLVILAEMLECARSGVLYNTQLVASAAGELSAYRKTHVPASENGRFNHGSELPIFRLERAAIGIQICYDSHFPEATIVQALRGAEVIFMPHASTGPEGAGEVEIDGVVTLLRQYDTTYIREGQVHAFRSTGDEPMRILWIYSSDRVSRTLSRTGETVDHLSAKGPAGPPDDSTIGPAARSARKWNGKRVRGHPQSRRS
jgi:predicted amidohydrolase